MNANSASDPGSAPEKSKSRKLTCSITGKEYARHDLVQLDAFDPVWPIVFLTNKRLFYCFDEVQRPTHPSDRLNDPEPPRPETWPELMTVMPSNCRRSWWPRSG